MNDVLNAYLVGVATCLLLSGALGVADLAARRWGGRLRFIGSPPWRWVLRELAEAVLWPVLSALALTLGVRYLVRVAHRRVREVRAEAAPRAVGEGEKP